MHENEPSLVEFSELFRFINVINAIVTRVTVNNAKSSTNLLALRIVLYSLQEVISDNFHTSIVSEGTQK